MGISWMSIVVDSVCVGSIGCIPDSLGLSREEENEWRRVGAFLEMIGSGRREGIAVTEERAAWVKAGTVWC